MKIKPSQKIIRKGFVSVISLVFAFQNVGLLHSAESNFWEERRQVRANQRQEIKKAHELSQQLKNPETLMASLPKVDAGLALPFSGKALSELGISNDLGANQKAGLAKKWVPDWMQVAIAPHATIQDVSLSDKPEAKTVLLVQDAHLHFEAQENIAGVIDEVARGLKANKDTSLLVGLEGADIENFDHTAYAEIPNQPVLRKVSKAFLKANILSGPEYAVIGFLGKSSGADKTVPIDITGVEAQQEYDDNVKALRNAVPLKEKASAALQSLKQELVALKKENYTKDHFVFDAKLTGFEEGTIGVPEYVLYLDSVLPAVKPNSRQLISAALLEGSIDFKKVERERAAMLNILVEKMAEREIKTLLQYSTLYRSGKLSYAAYYGHLKKLAKRHGVDFRNYPEMSLYIQYVLKSEGIDPAGLFAEVQEHEKRVQNKLFNASGQKEIAYLTQDYHLLEKLSQHILTEDEWYEYKTRQTKIKNLEGRFEKLGHALPEPVKAMKDYWQVLEDFYESAIARNATMAERMATRLAASSSDTGVLVAGGFHTQGLVREFKKYNVSVLTLSPKITKLENGVSSLDFLAKNQTPLDQLFRGERLFVTLARAFIETPGRVLGLHQAATAAAVPGNTDVARSGNWTAQQVPANGQTTNMDPDVTSENAQEFDVEGTKVRVAESEPSTSSSSRGFLRTATQWGIAASVLIIVFGMAAAPGLAETVNFAMEAAPAIPSPNEVVASAQLITEPVVQTAAVTNEPAQAGFNWVALALLAFSIPITFLLSSIRSGKLGSQSSRAQPNAESQFLEDLWNERAQRKRSLTLSVIAEVMARHLNINDYSPQEQQRLVNEINALGIESGRIDNDMLSGVTIPDGDIPVQNPAAFTQNLQTLNRLTIEMGLTTLPSSYFDDQRNPPTGTNRVLLIGVVAGIALTLAVAALFYFGVPYFFGEESKKSTQVLLMSLLIGAGVIAGAFDFEGKKIGARQLREAQVEDFFRALEAQKEQGTIITFQTVSNDLRKHFVDIPLAQYSRSEQATLLRRMIAYINPDDIAAPVFPSRDTADSGIPSFESLYIGGNAARQDEQNPVYSSEAFDQWLAANPRWSSRFLDESEGFFRSFMSQPDQIGVAWDTLIRSVQYDDEAPAKLVAALQNMREKSVLEIFDGEAFLDVAADRSLFRRSLLIGIIIGVVGTIGVLAALWGFGFIDVSLAKGTVEGTAALASSLPLIASVARDENADEGLDNRTQRRLTNVESNLRDLDLTPPSRRAATRRSLLLYIIPVLMLGVVGAVVAAFTGQIPNESWAQGIPIAGFTAIPIMTAVWLAVNQSGQQSSQAASDPSSEEASFDAESIYLGEVERARAQALSQIAALKNQTGDQVASNRRVIRELSQINANIRAALGKNEGNNLFFNAESPLNRVRENVMSFIDASENFIEALENETDELVANRNEERRRAADQKAAERAEARRQADEEQAEADRVAAEAEQKRLEEETAAARAAQRDYDEASLLPGLTTLDQRIDEFVSDGGELQGRADGTTERVTDLLTGFQQSFARGWMRDVTGEDLLTDEELNEMWSDMENIRAEVESVRTDPDIFPTDEQNELLLQIAQAARDVAQVVEGLREDRQLANQAQTARPRVRRQPASTTWSSERLANVEERLPYAETALLEAEERIDELAGILEQDPDSENFDGYINGLRNDLLDIRSRMEALRQQSYDGEIDTQTYATQIEALLSELRTLINGVFESGSLDSRTKGPAKGKGSKPEVQKKRTRGQRGSREVTVSQSEGPVRQIDKKVPTLLNELRETADRGRKEISESINRVTPSEQVEQAFDQLHQAVLELIQQNFFSLEGNSPEEIFFRGLVDRHAALVPFGFGPLSAIGGLEWFDRLLNGRTYRDGSIVRSPTLGIEELIDYLQRARSDSLSPQLQSAIEENLLPRAQALRDLLSQQEHPRVVQALAEPTATANSFESRDQSTYEPYGDLDLIDGLTGLEQNIFEIVEFFREQERTGQLNPELKEELLLLRNVSARSQRAIAWRVRGQNERALGQLRELLILLRHAVREDAPQEWLDALSPFQNQIQTALFLAEGIIGELNGIVSEASQVDPSAPQQQEAASEEGTDASQSERTDEPQEPEAETPASNEKAVATSSTDGTPEATGPPASTNGQAEASGKREKNRSRRVSKRANPPRKSQRRGALKESPREERKRTRSSLNGDPAKPGTYFGTAYRWFLSMAKQGQPITEIPTSSEKTAIARFMAIAAMAADYSSSDQNIDQLLELIDLFQPRNPNNAKFVRWLRTAKPQIKVWLKTDTSLDAVLATGNRLRTVLFLLKNRGNFEELVNRLQGDPKNNLYTEGDNIFTKNQTLRQALEEPMTLPSGEQTTVFDVIALSVNLNKIREARKKLEDDMTYVDKDSGERFLVEGVIDQAGQTLNEVGVRSTSNAGQNLLERNARRLRASAEEQLGNRFDIEERIRIQETSQQRINPTPSDPDRPITYSVSSADAGDPVEVRRQNFVNDLMARRVDDGAIGQAIDQFSRAAEAQRPQRQAAATQTKTEPAQQPAAPQPAAVSSTNGQQQPATDQKQAAAAQPKAEPAQKTSPASKNGQAVASKKDKATKEQLAALEADMERARQQAEADQLAAQEEEAPSNPLALPRFQPRAPQRDDGRLTPQQRFTIPADEDDVPSADAHNWNGSTPRALAAASWAIVRILVWTGVVLATWHPGLNEFREVWLNQSIVSAFQFFSLYLPLGFMAEEFEHYREARDRGFNPQVKISLRGGFQIDDPEADKTSDEWKAVLRSGQTGFFKLATGVFLPSLSVGSTILSYGFGVTFPFNFVTFSATFFALTALASFANGEGLTWLWGIGLRKIEGKTKTPVTGQQSKILWAGFYAVAVLLSISFIGSYSVEFFQQGAGVVLSLFSLVLLAGIMVAISKVDGTVKPQKNYTPEAQAVVDEVGPVADFSFVFRKKLESMKQEGTFSNELDLSKLQEAEVTLRTKAENPEKLAEEQERFEAIQRDLVQFSQSDFFKSDQDLTDVKKALIELGQANHRLVQALARLNAKLAAEAKEAKKEKKDEAGEKAEGEPDQTQQSDESKTINVRAQDLSRNFTRFRQFYLQIRNGAKNSNFNDIVLPKGDERRAGFLMAAATVMGEGAEEAAEVEEFINSLITDESDFKRRILNDEFDTLGKAVEAAHAGFDLDDRSQLPLLRGSRRLAMTLWLLRNRNTENRIDQYANWDNQHPRYSDLNYALDQIRLNQDPTAIQLGSRVTTADNQSAVAIRPEHPTLREFLADLIELRDAARSSSVEAPAEPAAQPEQQAPRRSVPQEQLVDDEEDTVIERQEEAFIDTDPVTPAEEEKLVAQAREQEAKQQSKANAEAPTATQKKKAGSSVAKRFRNGAASLLIAAATLFGFAGENKAAPIPSPTPVEQQIDFEQQPSVVRAESSPAETSARQTTQTDFRELLEQVFVPAYQSLDEQFRNPQTLKFGSLTVSPVSNQPVLEQALSAYQAADAETKASAARALQAPAQFGQAASVRAVAYDGTINYESAVVDRDHVLPAFDVAGGNTELLEMAIAKAGQSDKKVRIAVLANQNDPVIQAAVSGASDNIQFIYVSDQNYDENTTDLTAALNDILRQTENTQYQVGQFLIHSTRTNIRFDASKVLLGLSYQGNLWINIIFPPVEIQTPLGEKMRMGIEATFHA